MKNCIKCNFVGEKSFFRKKENICLVCARKHYRLEHKEIIQKQKKQYYSENKEVIQEYQKQYRLENKETRIEYDRHYNKQYHLENKENRRKYKKQYYLNHKNDPYYKIRMDISTTIYVSLKRNGASKQRLSCMQHLPYTIQKLKQHIENLFEPWMTWENRGKYDPTTWNDKDSTTWKWQLDHIIPHSLFKYDSMNSKEFKDCWSLSNLRPLSAKQNLLDGATRKRHL